MTEEEKNVYKCLFEYPTKKIASLEIENLKLEKELDQYKNNWEELKEYILNHYIVGHEIQNTSLDNILNKMKELEEKNND